MSTSLKAGPQVVDEREWRTAYHELLAKEKALTHARDELAAHRRRLPMVRVAKNYSFEGVDGAVTLLELFEKYQWLENRIGRGLPIPISKQRQQVYARRLRRRRSAHIAELPPFRQELETMCFAAVCLGTLADDMLRLLEIRITSIWTWATRLSPIG